mgnify:CR=1 FL=1
MLLINGTQKKQLKFIGTMESILQLNQKDILQKEIVKQLQKQQLQNHQLQAIEQLKKIHYIVQERLLIHSNMNV